MTNIVFKTEFGREVEIDFTARRFRVSSELGGFYGWTSYVGTDRPIGLGHIEFWEPTGDEMFLGWPDVAFNFTEFVELRDDERPAPYTAAEWQRQYVKDDIYQRLIDAIEAAPDPSVADFKISEAAEEMHEILERRSAGPVQTTEWYEELLNDFFDQFDPEDHLGKWADTPDEPDLVIALDLDGSVRICVVLTTIDPSDFTDQI